MAVHSYLNKNGLANLWTKIKAKFLEKPSGGTTGQVITKTDNGIEWKDPSSGIEISEDGSIGDFQFLATKYQVQSYLTGDPGINIEISQFSPYTTGRGDYGEAYNGSEACVSDHYGGSVFLLPNGNVCSVYTEVSTGSRYFFRICVQIYSSEGILISDAYTSQMEPESSIYSSSMSICLTKLNKSSYPITFGILTLGGAGPTRNAGASCFVNISEDNLITINNVDEIDTALTGLDDINDIGLLTIYYPVLNDGSRIGIVGRCGVRVTSVQNKAHAVAYKITPDGLLVSGPLSKTTPVINSTDVWYKGYCNYNSQDPCCFKSTGGNALFTVDQDTLKITPNSSLTLPSTYNTLSDVDLPMIDFANGTLRYYQYHGKSSPDSSDTEPYVCKFFLNNGKTVPTGEHLSYLVNIDSASTSILTNSANNQINSFIRASSGLCSAADQIQDFTRFSKFMRADMTKSDSTYVDLLTSKEWISVVCSYATSNNVLNNKGLTVYTLKLSKKDGS